MASLFFVVVIEPQVQRLAEFAIMAKASSVINAVIRIPVISSVNKDRGHVGVFAPLRWTRLWSS
jgi:hypothetical protein